ncbi:Phosphoglycerate mutase-like protein [Vigna angularis]|uniref:Phosphoglycerate mutase-like protein n=1 Tax=Phaseolus angularis TaxID=3914 RepID=A0A8T0JFN0_PHAAN|nr:Phosphoglycerate mutase-like protein [Vigna angularis]
MRVEKALRQLYGRFFYRFSDGESAVDVYDRITGVATQRSGRLIKSNQYVAGSRPNTSFEMMDKGFISNI